VLLVTAHLVHLALSHVQLSKVTLLLGFLMVEGGLQVTEHFRGAVCQKLKSFLRLVQHELVGLHTLFVLEGKRLEPQVLRQGRI
jgi:hypothetical protein